MTIEGQIATTLINKEIICPFHHRTLFSLLQKDGVKERVALLLEHFGLNLEQTSSGQGYYASTSKLDEEAKAHASSLFKNTMKSVRFYLHFLELITKALHVDFTVVPGEELSSTLR